MFYIDVHYGNCRLGKTETATTESTPGKIHFGALLPPIFIQRIFSSTQDRRACTVLARKLCNHANDPFRASEKANKANAVSRLETLPVNDEAEYLAAATLLDSQLAIGAQRSFPSSAPRL